MASTAEDLKAVLDRVRAEIEAGEQQAASEAQEQQKPWVSGRLHQGDGARLHSNFGCQAKWRKPSNL